MRKFLTTLAIAAGLAGTIGIAAPAEAQPRGYGHHGYHHGHGYGRGGYYGHRRDWHRHDHRWHGHRGYHGHRR